MARPGKASNGDTLGFEAKMWQAADKLRTDSEAIGQKLSRLTKELQDQFVEGRRLENQIQKNLSSLVGAGESS